MSSGRPTHFFEARNTQEVLARITRSLGENAIILESGERKGSVWMVAAEAESSGSAAFPVASPDSLASFLEEAGFSEALMAHFQSFCASFREKKAGPKAVLIAFFQELLEKRAALFNFDAALARDRPTCILLVGATGQGKTVTTAKFAVTLMQQNVLPVLASLDVNKSGGILQLETLMSPLYVPVHAIETRNEMQALQAAVQPHTLIFLDTPGLNLFDASDRRLIAQWREGTGGTLFGLIRAGGDFHETRAILRIMKEEGITRVGLTHCDATRRLGAVLSAILDSSLTLEFLCDSPLLARAPQLALAETIVQLLLTHAGDEEKWAA
ncbi:MAG: hypothetical protein LBJ70_04905 [Holosporales bacterium]|jgi:flagellar biosynthesis protein FlhF|nr:hypothetical protein [Holosporales bacterium]